MFVRLSFRLAVVLVIYFLIAVILSEVHDYPAFRHQLQLERENSKIALDHKWLKTFYFFNEAGDGIKYYVTQNNRYMNFYPTSQYHHDQNTNR